MVHACKQFEGFGRFAERKAHGGVGLGERLVYTGMFGKQLGIPKASLVQGRGLVTGDTGQFQRRIGIADGVGLAAIHVGRHARAGEIRLDFCDQHVHAALLGIRESVHFK